MTFHGTPPCGSAALFSTPNTVLQSTEYSDSSDGGSCQVNKPKSSIHSSTHPIEAGIAVQKNNFIPPSNLYSTNNGRNDFNFRLHSSLRAPAPTDMQCDFSMSGQSMNSSQPLPGKLSSHKIRSKPILFVDEDEEDAEVEKFDAYIHSHALCCILV